MTRFRRQDGLTSSQHSRGEETSAPVLFGCGNDGTTGRIVRLRQKNQGDANRTWDKEDGKGGNLSQTVLVFIMIHCTFVDDFVKASYGVWRSE